MIEFLRPWAFVLLPLPILAWRMLPLLAARTSLIVPERVLHQLTELNDPRQTSLRMQRFRLWLASVGWILLVAALAAPITADKPLKRSSGRDLLLAVDLSASMTVKDVTLDGRQVDRFTAVKSLAAEFIRRREGDRVGLIVFADQTYLVAPLTFDVNAVSAFLDEVVVGLPGRKTAVGDAIGLAIKTLQSQPLIIVPTIAATLAVEHSVRVHTIGFAGSQGGAESQAELADLASLTGGTHHVANSTQALGAVYAELDRLEPTETESVGQRVERDWVQELLILAMLSLTLLTLADLRQGRL